MSKGEGTFLPLSADATISRRHIRIFWHVHQNMLGYFIECESRNGIKVNGMLVLPENGPIALHDRTRIQAGPFVFYILFPGHIVS